MALLREQIEQILTFEGKNAYEELMYMLQHANVLEDYFRDLLNKLQRTKSPKENAEQYPAEGPLLTLAATHRFIANNATVGRLVIDCIIEYSKLDLNPTTSNPKILDKTMAWSVARLRRITCSRHTLQDRKDNEAVFKTISTVIAQKRNSLKNSTMNRLLDMSVSLFNEQQVFSLIEQLLAIVLKDVELKKSVDEMHSNAPKADISRRFMEGLYKTMNDTGNSNTLRNWFYYQLNDDLRTKLLATHNYLFETEVLQFIENYLQFHQSSLHNSYLPYQALYQFISEDTLLQSIRQSAYLVNLFIEKMVALTLSFFDWRLLRLIRCIAVFFEPSLPKVFQQTISFIPTNDYHQQTTIYSKISDFLYAGHNKEVNTKQQIAWCLSMSSTRLTWNCIYSLVKWCEGSDPWTTQMDRIILYVNWLIYPSMDLREAQSLAELRSWIQSCQVNNGLRRYLPLVWRTLLNSNAIVVACFMICVLFSSKMDLEGQTAFIEDMFACVDSKQADGFLEVLYASLDYLYDIQSGVENYLPPGSAAPATFAEHIPVWIDFMYETYNITSTSSQPSSNK